jgi:tetratricopeptide (TPR) repeat protein
VQFLIGILGGIIAGIVVGIVLYYLQREKIDAFLETIQLLLLSRRLAKKIALSYYAQAPSHIGAFGAYVSKKEGKEKIPYVRLQLLPKIMKECVKLYKPDRDHQMRTWGTVGHVLYEQARKYYNNDRHRQVKILQRAAEAFKEELRIHHDPRAVNRMGQIQILLGQFLDAERTLSENVSKIANNPSFYSSLNDPELQDSYRRSLYILSSLYLGEFSQIQDKRTKAISLLTLYIDLQSPDFYQYHVALSKRGTLYALNGQFEEAQRDFEVINPDKLEPKVNIGFLHNNIYKLFSNQTRKAFSEREMGLVDKYWQKAELAFAQAQQTHEYLREQPPQAYYDRVTETDLKHKYEAEFQSVVQDYYSLRGTLRR